MAGKSLLLHEDEFTKLVEGRFRKLEKLDLPEKTKAGLLRRAKKMLPKGTAEPLGKFVMCKMIGDTLVCKVVGSQSSAKPGKKAGKTPRKAKAPAGAQSAKKTASAKRSAAAKKTSAPKKRAAARKTEPAATPVEEKKTESD